MAIVLEMKQQLAKLLAKPSLVGPTDGELLSTLVKAYPYYQPLHLLLAKANTEERNPNYLAKAALYNGGALLHQTIYQAETFAPKAVNVVSTTESISGKGGPVNGAAQVLSEPSERELPNVIAEEIHDEEDNFDEIADINIVSENRDQPAISPFAQEESYDKQDTYDEIAEVNTVPHNVDEPAIPTATQEESEEKTYEEIVEINTVHNGDEPAIPALAQEESDDEHDTYDEIAEVNTVTQNVGEPVIPALAQEESDDEQDIYDEIAEVNNVPRNVGEPAIPALAQEEGEEEDTFEEIAEVSSFSQESPKPSHLAVAQEDENEVPTQDELASYEPKTDANAEPDEQIFDEIGEVDANNYQKEHSETNKQETEQQNELLPDELAIESIVSTDFFAFEQSFSTDPSETSQNAFPVTFNPPEEYNVEAEAQTVSKYDDDKLPYTFLWWLAKTRKEHAQIFQPYVAVKKDPAPVAGQLQQQYVEHIFHLQTPFNIADEAKKTTPQSVAHKGEDIIDSFIKNEPQIGAPKPELINNENKAKKSAEDSYDLVTETLASIYIEQMLYHKAIDTYEKLSLKFPEKSRYFADLIQSLEKKI